MRYEIKCRFTGRVLYEKDAESLRAVVEAAVSVGARLNGANLDGARLNGARLYGARLNGAGLNGASLEGAVGVNPISCTPLLMLLDQPGAIWAYKLVTERGEGPFNGGIYYAVGQDYEVANANTDPNEPCAAGIHLATLDWCVKGLRPGYRILIAEFTAADIAAIPTATDGKIRVHRCRIVGEKSLEELGLGLVKQEKAAP
jgi:uncharacterized protein YjbI with pentapeptide repeats